MHPYLSNEIARGRRRLRLARSANRRAYNDAKAKARHDVDR